MTYTDRSNYTEPPNPDGTRCTHCGMPQRGHGSVNTGTRDYPVCHTGGPFPDCYRLVTVHHEVLGLRNVNPGKRAADLVRIRELENQVTELERDNQKET